MTSQTALCLRFAGAVTLICALAIPASASDLAALWRDACLWEVGSNAEKVPAARTALIARGAPALEFLVPDKLDTKDTLVTRALEVVMTGLGKSAEPRLIAALEHEKANVRRNAADLLGSLGAVAAAPRIVKLLDHPDTRLGALFALGKLNSQESVPAVVAVMTSDAPQRVRYTAAATLGAIDGVAATTALIDALAGDPAPLRFAAQYALEKRKAVAALRPQLSHATLRVRLHAIAALAHIGDASVRDDLARMVADPSPLVRGFVFEALAAMLDDATRRQLELCLPGETDPFARGKLLAALGRVN